MTSPVRGERSTRRALVAGAVLTLLTAAGCGARDVPDELGVVTGGLTVNVENRNFYDATVYLVSGSVRNRLGVVEANGARRFQSEWLGAYVAVEIRLLSVGAYRSDRIAVSPGDAVDIRIPPDLDRWRPIPGSGTGASGVRSS